MDAKRAQAFMASWAAWETCELEGLAGWMGARDDSDAKSSQLATAAAAQARMATPIRSRLRGTVTRSLAGGYGWTIGSAGAGELAADFVDPVGRGAGSADGGQVT